MKKVLIAILTMLAISCGSKNVEALGNASSGKFSGFYSITKVNDSVVGSYGPTFNIDTQKKRIYGFAGCNSYSAAYRLSNGTLKISPPLHSRKACPDAIDLERMVLKAIPKANRYTVAKRILTLYNDEEVIIIAKSTDY